MTQEILRGTGFAAERSTAATRLQRVFHAGENALVCAVLGAMAFIPIAEIVLRSTVRVGISGASSIVQHMTLVVAMLGGALAAREGRLLSLSTGAALLPPKLRAAARILSGGAAGAITALLCVASVQFVNAERAGSQMLTGKLPIWAVQVVLPLGFALVAVRILWHAGDGWISRLLATLVTAGCIAAAWGLPVEPGAFVIPGLSALLVATVLGAPVFTTLGGAALVLFFGAEVPIAAIPVETYRMTVQPMLPTIPLFTLAGYFLAEGGASHRLVRVFQALAGWIRGGPAIVTVLVCAFFTSFTGASGVTILALGGLLMPVLLAARFPEKGALGLLTTCGSLGLLFPPSLPVILYGITSRTAVDKMFLGGLIPGILTLAVTAWWGRRQGRRAGERPRFDAREAGRAIWAAKWELLLPIVVLVGLFGGFATLVEAAALTALYAFVVETFVYGDLSLRKDLLRVMTECGVLIGGVLLILGVALGFTNYLIDAEVPARGVEWLRAAVQLPWVFLLVLNVFLLIVGCLMDIFSAIVVVVPLIAPIGAAYGIDPVHLGIVFLANMELGYITPPVGMNLFLSSYRFGKPLPEVYRSVVPLLIVRIVAVLVITYLPFMTTALPRWIGGP